jgi:hypothetical protein
MYWSIYDVLMLISGLITLIIVFAPVQAITSRTRLAAGGIGGTLLVASLVLASIPFFRYPAIVIAAPLIALLSVVAVMGKAFRGHSSLQTGQQGHSVHPQPVERADAAFKTHDHESSQDIPSSLPPRDLMELAASDQTRWLEVVRHPSAYPALLDWLDQYGSAEVRIAVAERRQRETHWPA